MQELLRENKFYDDDLENQKKKKQKFLDFANLILEKHNSSNENEKYGLNKQNDPFELLYYVLQKLIQIENSVKEALKKRPKELESL